MNITISLFDIELYESVLELWQQCEGVGLSSADSRDGIRAYLERNPGMSFVATADRGKVLGAVLGGHDGRRGYIHHLSVHPDCRRQGLAGRLVGKCVQAIKDEGIQKCHIFIFNENTNGIQFWKKIGWSLRSDIRVVSKVIDSNV